ncbi:MAG: hypothetical protein A2Z04_06695 [Chloroflexi bacterium RBG_16_57_9]|nr:MAG: hypothetical protein A2Z04_06695 [Chloroflexi bacterium RBG_16_57_9]
MPPVTLTEKKLASAEELMGEMIPKLLRQVVECPACGRPVRPQEGLFLPIKDKQGIKRAWFLFHPECVQPETDLALEKTFDQDTFDATIHPDRIEVMTELGPVSIPIVGVIAEPIWTGPCTFCGYETYWKDSHQVKPGKWVHDSCAAIQEVIDED